MAVWHPYCAAVVKRLPELKKATQPNKQNNTALQ